MALKSLRLIYIESHHIPIKDNGFVNACLLAFCITSNLPKWCKSLDSVGPGREEHLRCGLLITVEKSFGDNQIY